MNDKEIQRLVLGNSKLKRELKKIAKLEHCRTCQNMKQRDCFTLYYCRYLGYVDPDKDGCTKHKGGTDV